MSLQTAILDGLEVRNWDESIASVKRTVAKALQALDRGVEVKDTQFFNHSFVPDFVLSWRNDAQTQRDVFLRLDASPSFIDRDVEILGSQAPLLLSLTDEWTQGSGGTGGRDLNAGDGPRTLVTEPRAVERLGEASKGSNFGRVIPAALLKGGRGWIDEPIAAGMAAASSSFFSGASQHQVDEVEAAVPMLRSHLDGVEARRVLKFGRIVWEATGGDPSQYPLVTDLSGLDDNALRFLLEEGPAQQPAFWRSVGRHVELDRLLGLGVGSGPNVAALVRSNADRLFARALLVKKTQATLDNAGPEWSIEPGALVLRGTDFAAYLAPRRDELSVAAPTGTGPR